VTRAQSAPGSPRNRRGDWYSIRNAESGDEPTEILIYDEIGSSWWGGVSAKQFAKDLSAIDATAITVRLNSPGGDVFEGIAILNALRDHKAKITVRVDGLAASAASFIAMAGDEIVMGRNSEMMIHDAWGYAAGNAAEVRKYADELDRVSNNIASIYAERTEDTTAEEWRDVMREEVWYSADEAVAAGLADRVEAKKADNSKDAAASFDLSIFNYAGRRNAPAPKSLASKASAPASEPSGAVNTTEEGGSDVAFTDEQTSELREALSLPEDATDQDIFDAVLEKLTEPETDPSTEEASTSDLVNQLSKRGLTSIDTATLNGLKSEVTEFRAFREERKRKDIEDRVSAAIKHGQIPTSSKEHWQNLLGTDPGAAAVLEALPHNLIPVTELGHGVDSESESGVVDFEAVDKFKNWMED
jgi:ATP-dependent protease ClpP protease subunit